MPVKPTVKTISSIRSLLLRPSLTSHFLCQFSPPDGVMKFLKSRSNSNFKTIDYTDPNDNDLLSLSCTEASLPGSSLATIDIDNDYHGVSEKHAYRRLYDDRSDFTFYVDSDYKIITFFENWISYCVGENLLNGTDQTGQDIGKRYSQVNANYTYKVYYPTNYKTNRMFITKFERDFSNEPLTYQFIGAFPISINSMPVSYDSSNLLKCTVSFSYTRYVIGKGEEGVGITPPNQEESFNNPNSILSRGTAAAIGPVDNTIPSTTYY
jgi:hypothetical protein